MIARARSFIKKSGALYWPTRRRQSLCRLTAAAPSLKALLGFLAVCVLGAWIPTLATVSRYDPSTEEFPGWEAAPLPSHLTPVMPGEREARFAEGFPGKIGVFTDGERTFIARWIRTPTRKLHPASDCLRALGYGLRPGPLFAGADGTHWGTSRAEKCGRSLRVRERILDSVGREWTDVSAWYWSAAFGRSCGPWWAITILEGERPTAP